MSLKKALLAATMLALPLAAQAQPINGLYVGAGAGVNYLQESDIELSRSFGGTTASRSGSAEFNYGYVGVLSLGYGFGNGVRAEIEGSYRENEVDSVSGFPGLARPLRSDGTARSYGIMANALYDFDLGPGAFVMPYVGVGAGYIWHEYDGTTGDRRRRRGPADRDRRQPGPLRLPGDRRRGLPDLRRPWPGDHRRVPLPRHALAGDRRDGACDRRRPGDRARRG
jgi:opacity protein-like surface antigen